MRCMKYSIAIVLAICLSLGRMSASAAPDPPSGIDVVWAYAGVWKVETEHFDTAQSKAGHEKATLRNACWKNGGYLACNQYVDGDSKTLIVFTYDEKAKVYTSYPIPLGGGVAGSGKLIIEGGVWTFPWKIAEGDKTTYFRVVNVFRTPDHIEFTQEFSPDNMHWTVMAKGTETKIASAEAAQSPITLP
jgi:hypothetical protein